MCRTRCDKRAHPQQVTVKAGAIFEYIILTGYEPWDNGNINSSSNNDKNNGNGDCGSNGKYFRRALVSTAEGRRSEA